MSEAIKGKNDSLTAFAGVGDKAENVKAQAPAAVSPEKTQALADIELEMRKLELEEKRLAVELSKANLVDVRERLDDRQMKRENVGQRSRGNGEIIRQINANTKGVQDRCNHRKGGDGLAGLMNGQGDDDQYAVWKHTFANGDTWVGCLRCYKKWKPPVAAEYATPAEFDAAQQVYITALNFSTKNKPSASGRFQFSDNGQQYRANTKNA